MVSQTIMGILPKPARITGGEILFRDPATPDEVVDLTKLAVDGEHMRTIRGGRISIHLPGADDVAVAAAHGR